MTPPAGYYQVWKDDFAGGAVDTTNNGWFVYDNHPVAGGTDFAAQVTVANSICRLRTDSNLHTGRLKTNRRYRLGYFEALIQFPLVHGTVPDPAFNGTFPAFWLWNADSSDGNYQEIDFEWRGGFAVSNYGYIYNLTPKTASTGTGTPNYPFDGVYHTYGLLWEANLLSWFIDGVLNQTLTLDASLTLFPRTMNVVLDNAIGGTYALSPDANTVYPSDMNVDYVAVYQKKRAPLAGLA